MLGAIQLAFVAAIPPDATVQRAAFEAAVDAGASLRLKHQHHVPALNDAQTNADLGTPLRYIDPKATRGSC